MQTKSATTVWCDTCGKPAMPTYYLSPGSDARLCHRCHEQYWSEHPAWAHTTQHVTPAVIRGLHQVYSGQLLHKDGQCYMVDLRDANRPGDSVTLKPNLGQHRAGDASYTVRVREVSTQRNTNLAIYWCDITERHGQCDW